MGETLQNCLGIGFLIVLVVGVFGSAIFGACVGYPNWKVYQQTKSGEAKLREAESSRKIRIEEAKALKEAAIFEAEAEVERARGVAEANEIIGDSLRDNEGYLRYLWINGLHDGSSETIYIPTEANLPIMEAGRYMVRKE